MHAQGISLRSAWNPFRSPALATHDYRWYWYASLTNDIGGTILFAAHGAILFRLDAGPSTFTLMLVLRMLPKAVLGLIGGALSDRSAPIAMLRVARFAGAIPALLCFVPYFGGALSVEVVLLSAALASVISAFDQPPNRTLLYRCAPGPLLISGVAGTNMASTISHLVGAGVFGAFIEYGNPVWLAPLSMALIVASTATLFKISVGREPATRTASSVGRESLAGLRMLLTTPFILALVLLSNSPGLLDRIGTLMLPDYAGNQADGAAMSVLLLAPSTGALLGGSALAWLGGEMRRLMPMALGSSGVAVVSVSLLATTRLFVLTLVLCLVLGAAKSAFSVALNAALQRHVPDHARGRILSF